MVNGIRTTWEEETNAMLQKEIERIGALRSQSAKIDSELEGRQAYADALQKVLEFNRQERSIEGNGRGVFDPEKFLKQSVKDSLFDIATSNNGLLVVNDAVTILVEANVFSDRDHARNAIYSNIGHYRKHFGKERAGVYRFKGTNKGIPLPFSP